MLKEGIFTRSREHDLSFGPEAVRQCSCGKKKGSEEETRKHIDISMGERGEPDREHFQI